MKNKWTQENIAVLRAAYITATGAVIAAGITAAVVFLPSSSHSAAGGTASGTATAQAPSASASHTPSATPSPAAPAGSTPSSGPTWTEWTYSRSDTFADYVNAGTPGKSLIPGQSVKVSCRVKGFAVADGDTWWYRIAGSPWDGGYYATTDNFYNTPTPTGNPINGIVFDKRVPVC